VQNPQLSPSCDYQALLPMLVSQQDLHVGEYHRVDGSSCIYTTQVNFVAAKQQREIVVQRIFTHNPRQEHDV
jgi:hypothetical protein